VRGTRLIAALLALALVAAACGRDEGDSEAGGGDPPTTEDGEGTGGDAPEGDATGLDAGGFGDLESVCSEGDGSERSGGETGLSADEIRIGTFSDKGATVRPGLTREMHDAAVAFAAWCNEHGGLGGRRVVIEDLDAKLFEFEPRIIDACDRVFAVVGGGAVFDDDPNDVRVGCDLIAVPGYVVSPRGRVADLQVQPVPNPVHMLRAGHYRRLAEVYPDATGAFGIMTGNLPSTQLVRDQTVEAVGSLGYQVVYNRDYNSAGETGWRNFVTEMRDAGVEIFEFIGEPENLTSLQQAMDIEGWYPEVIVQQTNFYDEKYVAEGGGIAGNTLIHSTYHPLELADDNQATADYLELIERYNPGGKVALLGMQATSALLLFATAVNDCGSDLTRACVLEAASATTDWTAGGLHSPQQPGNTVPGSCFLFLEVDESGFTYNEDLTDPDEGLFNCGEDNIVELVADYGVPRPEA
jgi:hypothetical protein